MSLRGASRIMNLLAEHKEQAFLSQQLATIAINSPIKAGVRVLKRKDPDISALNKLFNRLQFGDRIRQRITDLPV